MEGFVGLFCGFLLATIVWFTYIPDAVRAERNTAWQKDAVKHGVAEYVLKSSLCLEMTQLAPGYNILRSIPGRQKHYSHHGSNQ